MAFRVPRCNALIGEVLAEISFSQISSNDPAWDIAKSFGKALVLTILIRLDLFFIIFLQVELPHWLDQYAGFILHWLVMRFLWGKGNIGLCEGFNWRFVLYVCQLILQTNELISAVVWAIWTFHDKVIKCPNKNYFIFLTQIEKKLSIKIGEAI